MRPIDADKMRMLFASGVRVYDGMCKIEDVMHNIDNAPTIDADAYFDAVDRIKACPNCRYTHIHKMFSEYGQTPWKSFAEEKPLTGGRYITYSSKGSGTKEVFDLWYTGEKWHIDACGPEFNGTVTHWMPLPMGPEEV